MFEDGVFCKGGDGAEGCLVDCMDPKLVIKVGVPGCEDAAEKTDVGTVPGTGPLGREELLGVDW